MKCIVRSSCHEELSTKVPPNTAMNGSPCAIRRPSESFATRKTKTPPKPIHQTMRVVYFSFFLGRSWLVCPHLRFLQLVARGGRRA